MEMGGDFCQILELGGTTIKGRRVHLWRFEEALISKSEWCCFFFKGYYYYYYFIINFFIHENSFS